MPADVWTTLATRQHNLLKRLGFVTFRRTGRYCPCCFGSIEQGHTGNCELAELLRLGEALIQTCQVIHAKLDRD